MDLPFLLAAWQQQFNLADVTLLEQQLTIWHDFLIATNQQFNLTNLTANLYQDYFYTSLLHAKPTQFGDKAYKLLDVGSGSGIPGLVFKLVFPNLTLHIVEASQKKCLFLKQLVNLLKLNGVYIHNARCENWINNYQNSFDYVTARAVAPLRILLEMTIPGLKIGGQTWFLKGNHYQQEVQVAHKIAAALQLGVNPIVHQQMFANKQYVVLVYQKTQPTPAKYPRVYQQILHNDRVV